jgi:hypothetical protein
MAADMAVDFKDANSDVVAVSIWMGTLATERLLGMMAAESARFKHLEGAIESPELTGHVIWALFDDPRNTELTGQTLIGAELAQKYGIKEKSGGFARLSGNYTRARRAFSSLTKSNKHRTQARPLRAPISRKRGI